MTLSSISQQTWMIAGGVLFAALVGMGVYLRRRASMAARIERALKRKGA
ncbi:MAG: hypothetical protein KY410_00345 [Proteobacteria bacterium]|nr:hypothetical protein [Pseudomonadota bacterium]